MMLFAETGDSFEIEDVLERLFAEAADTMRSLPAAGPAGYGSGWPEIVQSASDMMQAMNDEKTEEREAQAERREARRVYEQAPPMRPRPNAAALKRFLLVTDWLRFIPYRAISSKPVRMRLLLALCSGLSPAKASRMPAFDGAGINTGEGMRYFKSSSLAVIAKHLRKRCPNYRICAL